MAPPATLDLDFVRAQFPSACWDWAFFENAGGSYVPESVVQRVSAYMRETQVQPGASFLPSATAAERMAEGQRLLAGLINADVRELIVGPSTTYNLYTLSHALRATWDAGDEVIVTNIDHEANQGCWRRLAETGIKVHEWPAHPDTHDLDVAALKPLLSDRTRLVCMTHCSNITGTINDVAAVAKVVHDAGAKLLVDGVAYAAHAPIDVQALGCDFYAFSLYKFYGPHVAALWGKAEHLLAARGQNHYFIAEDDIPLKLNPGGPNHEFTAALVGVADYIEALARHHLDPLPNGPRERAAAVFKLMRAHELGLSQRFLEFANATDSITIHGRTEAGEHRAPTFSFSVAGTPAADVCLALEPARVAIRNGHFYAHRLVSRLVDDAEDGVVRASMVHYNTADEVDRLIAGLQRVCG